MRKKKKIYTSKYEDEMLIYESTVKRIEIQNQQIGQAIKNVFYVESKEFPDEGRMCVLWGNTAFVVGDKIAMKGRMNPEGVFLAWSYRITNKERIYG